jgi:hypothetical protein
MPDLTVSHIVLDLSVEGVEILFVTSAIAFVCGTDCSAHSICTEWAESKKPSEFRQALDLDPVSIPFNRDLGDAFYFARQYDQSIEQMRKTQKLDPNDLQVQRDLIMA